jgi:hypothetical protein
MHEYVEVPMAWSRHRSTALELTVSILRKNRRPLSLQEIVAEIHKIDRTVLSGSSPEKSLYSMLYRHARRRAEGNPISTFKGNGAAPEFGTCVGDDRRLNFYLK